MLTKALSLGLQTDAHNDSEDDMVILAEFTHKNK